MTSIAYSQVLVAKEEAYEAIIQLHQDFTTLLAEHYKIAILLTANSNGSLHFRKPRRPRIREKSTRSNVIRDKQPYVQAQCIHVVVRRYNEDLWL